MRYIQLTDRLHNTKVSEYDFPWVSVKNWYYRTNNSGNEYAYTSHLGFLVPMHEFIYRGRGMWKRGMMIDHINGNSLDNRFSNMRICTHKQNVRNRRKTKRPCSSKYKGVFKNSAGNTYQAQITVDGNQMYLGCFGTEIEAAIIYNMAALYYFGRFALLNE